MEGIYFFGEHVRWNLGWSNPNQAGAFVAMWIPWLWGLGRLVAGRRGGGSWRAWPVLLVELGLWFLLCKTYSRGALVAAAVAGVLFFGWAWWTRLAKADWKLYCRATGFVESMRGAVTNKWGAHAPSRVVFGALAEDGVETGHALFHPEHQSNGRSSRFPARAPEIASEGAYAPQRCALHFAPRNPQILMRGSMVVARLAGIAVLLVATGFFSRIDPRFVAQDASAGNRLTLWKGGLQMISVSPWRGWGEGNSGSGFMHWFQPLDSTEQYAGMVNSYLHVGVERGLPVLALAVALAAGLAALGFVAACHDSGKRMQSSGGDAMSCGDSGDRRSLGGFAARLAGLAAGSSLVVFLVANGFSTLWNFPNLWWLPAFSALVAVASCFVVAGKRGWRVIGRTGMVAGVLAVVGVVALCGWGKAMPGGVMVKMDSGGNVSVRDATVAKTGRMLIVPDRNVLGDDWGKEIRRLAMAEGFRGWEISVGSATGENADPELIVACGGKVEEGIGALRRFPGSRLLLLHPLGKPEWPGLAGGGVSVIVPMLDTSGDGRRWRAACGRWKWKCVTSAGVGQDVRLVWPGVFVGWLSENSDSQEVVTESGASSQRLGQLKSTVTTSEHTEHTEDD